MNSTPTLSQSSTDASVKKIALDSATTTYLKSASVLGDRPWPFKYDLLQAVVEELASPSAS